MKNSRLYKDKQNKIWVMPKELVQAGVLDSFSDLDRFGFEIKIEDIILHVNNFLDNKEN